VASVTDPYGRILGSLTEAATFSSKYLLSCTHEAEWTPFQTHYFPANLVAPGIEPRTSGSVAYIYSILGEIKLGSNFENANQRNCRDVVTRPHLQ
jgi:hypothetical protein